MSKKKYDGTAGGKGILKQRGKKWFSILSLYSHGKISKSEFRRLRERLRKQFAKKKK